MLKLAKLLHHKGFHITFVNTEFNHKRLLKSRGPDSLNGLSDFIFETITDGLPPSDNLDSTQDIPSLFESTSKTCIVLFRKLLYKLNSSPPITCMVFDGVMAFTLQAAQELGIPNVLLWTNSFCGFAAYLNYPHLLQRGLIPFKDESDLKNGHLETTTIDWIPAEMKEIRMRDHPTFLRTANPNNFKLNFAIGEVEIAYKASPLIFNTFEALEIELLEAFKSQLTLPPILTEV